MSPLVRQEIHAILCLAVVLAVGYPASAPSQEPTEGVSQQEISKWADQLSKTEKLRYDKKYEEAIACYDRAIEISPNAQYKAEAYFHKAQGLETWDRQKSIAAYRQVLKEEPTPALRAETCFRLGSLHRNISLGKSLEEEKQIVETEFSNENCLPYFEMGAAAAGEYDRCAMSCRIYVALVYYDLSRKEEADAILTRLAYLDPSKAELFPEKRLYGILSPKSFFERKEETLQYVQCIREGAAKQLINFNVIPGDEESTLKRMQEFCTDHPHTLIAEEAEMKIYEVNSIQH